MAHKNDQDCIFCKIISGEVNSYKIYEDDHTLAFLDLYPAGDYHTLVVPKNHYKDIFETPKYELEKVISSVKDVTKLYQEKLGIENVQILNNSGSEAQQVVFHLHFHILPRKKGDGQNVTWQNLELTEEHAEELLGRLLD